MAKSKTTKGDEETECKIHTFHERWIYLRINV